MIELRADTAGVRSFRMRMHGLDELAGDLRPAFRQVAAWFYRLERDRFATRGHGSWRPAKPQTLRRKRGAGRGTMRRTDRLYRSLTQPVHPDAVRSLRRDEMHIGTRAPYARHHQRPRGGRKLIGLRQRDRRELQRIVMDGILG